ncbi:hypothetical protein B0T14DRAFT_559101 [Immersiella caudata]|uniref:DUF8212 domain-containing protein n=1 Tax=Immersiella caudata TaxID=314043 RepID=A0AA39XCT8_9PEZI|nr:hypothetical protein B0T14DRAFT_559101 [Immersiella caudata]
MSWASSRETTRIEDTAYCLLGILGINLPLLYGEEEKAFRRLQEEIIRTTPDLTILISRQPEPMAALSSIPREEVISGVLANSPRAFSGSGSITKGEAFKQPEFNMTRRGIKIPSNWLEMRELPGKDAFTSTSYHWKL